MKKTPPNKKPASSPNYIAIDFDGTCATHEYPGIGQDIGAIPVLLDLIEHGNHLVLFTMRSRQELLAACEWLDIRGVTLYGINRNPTQGWTTSPKAFAHLYIDDASLGCPLIFDPDKSDRPFVDWKAVRVELQRQGYLPPPTPKTYAKKRRCLDERGATDS